ncbi:DUF4129 domain-containing protein [Microbulbifer hainanensis]|uniref:DUF4129 domain-containing protein n=1 Tax=Microbulbifer hainanensis TaxID=2735675 RepID=UPI0018675BB4|nr:DUF4129 domain-containing protein [Microbulbifer hainanensis]
MDLNRLAVRARLRSPWESIDLGVALARRQWWPLFVVWLLPAALVFGATSVWLWDSPSLAIFLVWWLKPVYDRLPLFIASRTLFGESVSVAGALRQFPRQNLRDWFAWLTWRRLSPTRAFDMPVTLLEQSSGAARSARINVLHRKHASAATWLTVTGAHVEMFLSLALMALIYLFIPEQVEIDWLPFLASGELWLQWALNGLYLLVMAAVAPFYIVSGFALYIGRRIELEAWDIEIQFRNLRQRHQRTEKQSARTVVAQLLLLCVLGLATMAPSGSVRAEAPRTPEAARESVDQILSGDDFHRREKVDGWRLKDTEKQEDEFPEWMINFIEWLESLGQDDDREDEPSSYGSLGPLIGGLIELLLWGGAIALVLYLLWQFRDPLRQGLRLRRRPKAPPKAAPETLFGLDVRRSSLPADVCAEVLRLWRAGDQRGGLGLLYRATLSHLIERYQFEFGDHLTESECAQLVSLRQQPADGGADEDMRPVSGTLATFVQNLTAAWQQIAYAHRAPASARLEQLCGQWQEVFADAH